MNEYDIIIIGTGPAGLSAAITSTIRNKKILLFGDDHSSQKVCKAHVINNYLWSSFYFRRRFSKGIP